MSLDMMNQRSGKTRCHDFVFAVIFLTLCCPRAATNPPDTGWTLEPDSCICVKVCDTKVTA